MYDANCPSELCDENYIDKSGRRIAEREKDHNRRDHKLHILKHLLETEHELVTFRNKRKRQIVESLLIKQLRPTLNILDKSVLLKLFKLLLSFEMCY